MAKASRVFTGLNSHGIDVQVAEREDGHWFSRAKEPSAYSYRPGWTVWRSLDFTPKHPTRLKNGIEAGGAPEYIDLPADQQGEYLEWGFTNLKLVSVPNRLRLPEQ